MDIYDDDMVQGIIDILLEEGWDEIFSDRDNITYKHLAADPYSDHVIKISYDGDAVLVSEVKEGEVVDEIAVDARTWDDDIEEVENMIKSASGGIYYN